jgi:monoamine oxidase
VQYIAEPVLLRNAVRFKTRVKSIENNPFNDKPITLISDANESFHADAVIVTIPLGLLKRNEIAFSPSLPRHVQIAISNLGFGVLERIFIRFRKAWWIKPSDSTATKIGLEFFRFPSLLSTTEEIPRGTLNFYSFARIHNPQPVFGVYASTELGKFLISLPKENLKTILQTHYIPHLPNYEADNPSCQILDIDSSSWCRDPLSGYGSYTHIPAGSETGDENLNILSQKILGAEKWGIWFAGEHTAQTEIIGGLKYTNMATVTGAYQSGERAAQNVISIFS